MPDESLARQKRALIVINPASRRGQDCASLAESCARWGFIPSALAPASRSEVSEVIRRHAPDHDCVIVAGGDGTLNAAAPGLLETGLPLGVVPVGTANDLARTLGLPSDLEGCLEVIWRGRTRSIDVGLVNGTPFFNVASIGLSATLAKELTYEAKQRLGRFGYAVAAAKALMRARPFHATIDSDGEVADVRTLQVAVGNGRFYGGGMTVAETAHVDDGHLDLYSLEFSAAWKLALMLHSFRHGRHSAWDEVRAIKGKSFRISTRRPRAINADGEIVGNTPAKFSILPQRLPVFAP